jgi:hypothetical protein
MEWGWKLNGEHGIERRRVKNRNRKTHNARGQRQGGLAAGGDPG